MFETFHQSASKDFKPTFYNPFEVKHRRRTTKAQFRVLETAFQENNKPNASSRRLLAAQLGMTPRAVQVWFQNRRAKNKSSKGGALAGMLDEVEPGTATLALLLGDDDGGMGERGCGSSGSNGIAKAGKAGAGNRSRTGSAGSASEAGGSTNLGRRHSMPEMQPPILKDGTLPFRELHEAIFGKSGHHLSATAGSTMSANVMAAAAAAAAAAASSIFPIDAVGGGVGSSSGAAALPPAILGTIPISRAPAPPRKNSGCSANFLNSFLNLGISPGLESYGISPNAAVSYDPMISGDLGGGGQLLTTSPATHPELATPSISAPGSSPNLALDDLFQLQKCLRSGQPPNAAAVEAMAIRLTNSLSAAELDILMQNAGTHKKDSAFDFFGGGGAAAAAAAAAVAAAGTNDLSGLLFPSGADAANMVNPLELLSCMPNPSDHHFLFPSSYPEDTIDPQFS